MRLTGGHAQRLQRVGDNITPEHRRIHGQILAYYHPKHPDHDLSLPIGVAIAHRTLSQGHPQSLQGLPHFRLPLRTVVSSDECWSPPSRHDVTEQPVTSGERPLVGDGRGLHPLAKHVHRYRQVTISVLIRGHRAHQVNTPPCEGAIRRLHVLGQPPYLRPQPLGLAHGAPSHLLPGFQT